MERSKKVLISLYLILFIGLFAAFTMFHEEGEGDANDAFVIMGDFFSELWNDIFFRVSNAGAGFENILENASKGMLAGKCDFNSIKCTEIYHHEGTVILRFEHNMEFVYLGSEIPGVCNATDNRDVKRTEPFYLKLENCDLKEAHDVNIWYKKQGSELIHTIKGKVDFT